MTEVVQKQPELAMGPRVRDRTQINRILLYLFGVLIAALVAWRIITVANQQPFPLNYWAFQVINGLVLGGVYALIALGYTLVYGILFMINFAHGEVVMMGGFAGFFALQAAIALGLMEGSPAVVVLALLVITLIGMGTSAALGVTLERLAYRPLRTAPRLVPLISAIGASFFLQQAALIIFGVTPHNYRKPPLIDGGWTVGETGIFISITGVLVFGTSVALMIALFLIVQRTRLGRAMRAVAEDKDTAALMGMDVDRTIALTFLLGSALGGAGGVMLGFHNTVMRFNTGFIPGLKAFTAAVLGGIGNVPGAMVGSLVLGVVEALGPSLLGFPAEYKDAIAFTLLVLLLIFRPTGILGEVLSEKKA